MRANQRASVGVAMIALNAEHSLDHCLASFRPYVTQVVIALDDRTTDKTAKIARKHGALVVPFTMCEEHSCPEHGTVQAQHFARARDVSFAHLRSDLDFAFWIDSDDVLEGAELLPRVCEQLGKSDAIGAWMAYLYAYSKEGDQRRVNTLFHRERLLRLRMGEQRIVWKWQYRVHEVVVPVGVQSPKWALLEQAFPWASELKVVHQDGAHKTDSSARRNLLLLEIDFEDDPENSRTIFYIGNQHFALGDFSAAATWYSRLLAMGKNPYERWQSAVYMAKACMQMGDLGTAEAVAWEAIKASDEHPEPYHCLAESALRKGEYDQVVRWTNLARQKRPPPFFVFKNPLDYDFNSRLPLGDALERLGRITEARREYEAAYAIMPAVPVKDAIDRLKGTESALAIAEGLAEMLRGKPDDEIIRLYEAVSPPPEVRAFGRLRDVVIPAYLRRREQRFAEAA